MGLAERARLESVGGRAVDPFCGAASAVAVPTRYNPPAAKASQVEALMSLTRAINQLSAVSYQPSAISNQPSAISKSTAGNSVFALSLGERVSRCWRFHQPERDG